MSENVASADAVAEAGAAPTGRATTLTETVDRLSLTQALKDFEVANARTLDLTHRLTELNQELLELRSAHERLRIEHNKVLARRAAPRAAAEAAASQALRVARAVKRRLG
jgi:transcriptional antiterminator Rof (Rho-off)